jgi:hypothetical protein
MCDTSCAPIERKEDRTGASRYGLTLKKMNNQRNYREQQQNMNQRTGYMEDQEAAQPCE